MTSVEQPTWERKNRGELEPLPLPACPLLFRRGFRFSCSKLPEPGFTILVFLQGLLFQEACLGQPGGGPQPRVPSTCTVCAIQDGYLLKSLITLPSLRASRELKLSPHYPHHTLVTCLSTSSAPSLLPLLPSLLSRLCLLLLPSTFSSFLVLPPQSTPLM